jgi:hypothetical protein
MRKLSKALRAAAIGILIACAWQGPAASGEGRSQTKAYTTTVNYVAEFYPLWFTYSQSANATINRLVGPAKISPLYQTVVAINVDTLYASTFLDLSSQPVILTLPSTTVTYSILALDPYGNVLTTTNLAAGTPGTYGFTGPNFTGTLPNGVTQVPMTLDHLILIFRSDQYTSGGVNETQASETFRESIQLQTLSDWQQDPSAGQTLILPELFFATPYKTFADALIAYDPITFLKQLQVAVASPNTPPLTANQQSLSDKFNTLFAKGGDQMDFALGAQDAHTLILDDYLDNTDANGWIHFTNMGEWKPGQNLDRSAITEFIQYGNNIKAAAYYQTFKDGTGAALDGSDAKGYVLNIPADQIPTAKRFWSFTAYTPQSIELIKNKAKVYHVASYTPHLAYNSDGSITLYIAREKPHGVPPANWLPVGRGPFNIMLRVYGPQGSVAHNKYTPPAIEKVQ